MSCNTPTPAISSFTFAPTGSTQHTLRAVEMDGLPWFMVTDVMAIFDGKGVHKLTAKLSSNDLRYINLARDGAGSPRHVVCSEVGLFELACRSRSTLAEDFKRFICEELMPEIRQQLGATGKLKGASTGTPTQRIFTFAQGLDLRVIDKDGESWFVAKDVCDSLDLRDVSNAVKGLDDDEKGTHTVRTLGGNQQLMVINESGLYSLILKSRKPEAKAFKRWVTREVLPAIRKHGMYLTPEAERAALESPDDLFARAVLMANERLQKQEQRMQLLEHREGTKGEPMLLLVWLDRVHLQHLSTGQRVHLAKTAKVIADAEGLERLYHGSTTTALHAPHTLYAAAQLLGFLTR